MKLYAKKATWIMIGILAIIILASGLLVRFMDGIVTNEYGDDWREEMQEEIATTETEEYAESAVYIDVDRNMYHLENDIAPVEYSAMQFVYENIELSMLLSLFTIIVAAGILANEFQWGTIKLLLIRPVTRLKILAVKYVTVLLYALTLLIFMFVFSWIVGAILFGVNGFNPSAVVNEYGSYNEVNLLSGILQGFGYKMVNLVMMATFAFMVSAIFRSASMAIGFAIFLMFAGNMIVLFLAEYDFAKYILFANTDLSQYRDGANQLLEGMSLSFSIVILLVYYVIFLAAAWFSFTKRDVAGQ